MPICVIKSVFWGQVVHFPKLFINNIHQFSLLHKKELKF